MKYLLVSLLFLGSPVLGFAFAVPGIPEYRNLTKADEELVVDARNFLAHDPVIAAHHEEDDSAWDVRDGKWEKIKYSFDAPVPPMGGIPRMMPKPPSGKSYMVFLSKASDGQLGLMGRTNCIGYCSALGSNLPAKDIIALIQNYKAKSILDVLPEIFARETDADCALLESSILVTGPSDYVPASAWKGFTSGADPKLLLAQLVVGLCAVGPDVLNDKEVASIDFINLGANSDGEITDENVDDAERNFSYWVARHGNPSNSTTILRFARKQKGFMQSSILQALSGCLLTKQDIVTVSTILFETTDINSKYACVRTLNNRLNKGGTPGTDDFIKNPDPYIKNVMELLKAKGYPLPSGYKDGAH